MFKTKILGLLRIKNEDRWLERCLISMRFCDHIIALDGNSTDNTPDICKSYGVEFYSEVPGGWNEGRDREFLAEKAIPHSPEWICSPDGDEVFMPDTYQEIEPFLNDPMVPVIESLNINLWNDEHTVRIDGVFHEGYRQRLWRFKPGKLTYEFQHCSLPNEITERPFVRAGKILHYGLIHPEERERTYAFYKTLGHDCPHIVEYDPKLLVPLKDYL